MAIMRIPFSPGLLALCASATVTAAQSRHPRVFVGVTETCAIASDGAARCWGLLTDDEMGVNAVATREPMRTLESGLFQACGLSERGKIMCARSMNPDVRDSCPAALCVFPIPKQVREPVSIVTDGLDHACALGKSGHAYCWGSNGMGQLGLGWRSADNSGSGGVPIRIPTAVFGKFRFRTISAGGMHTCALTLLGNAYCWGYGQSGQLGRDTVISDCVGALPQPNAPCSVDRPVRVKTKLRFRAISAGGGMTCAISVDDVAYCWGDNYRCGLGWCGEPQSPVPARIPLRGKVIEIDAGGSSACAITSDQRAWCWGNNTAGQLGSLVTIGAGRDGCFSGGMCTPAPTEVSGGHRWRSVSVGGGSACGVTVEDDIYCWGSSSEGRLAGFGRLEICANLSYDYGDARCSSTPVLLRFATSPFNSANDFVADYREWFRSLPTPQYRDTVADNERIVFLITKQVLVDLRTDSLNPGLPKQPGVSWSIRVDALDSATIEEFKFLVVRMKSGHTAFLPDTLIETLHIGWPVVNSREAVVTVDRGRLWCVNGNPVGVGRMYKYRLFRSDDGWHFRDRDNGVIYEPPSPAGAGVSQHRCKT